jgi:glutathione S-transferase
VSQSYVALKLSNDATAQAELHIMILYGTYFSPFARRVGAALLSRGVAFEHQPINGFEAPGEASRLNPVGRIPVLKLENGERLIDSWAILDFIDGLQPADLKLLPTAEAERSGELKIVAIATAACEIVGLLNLIGTTPVGSMMRRRDRLSEQLHGGVSALENWAAKQRPRSPLTIGTISAVVAFDYLKLARPETQWGAIAPALDKLTGEMRDECWFSNTNPLGASNE